MCQLKAPMLRTQMSVTSSPKFKGGGCYFRRVEAAFTTINLMLPKMLIQLVISNHCCVAVTL